MSASPPNILMLRLSIDPAAEPVTGILTADDGVARRFRGALDLLALVDQARAAAKVAGTESAPTTGSPS